MAKNQLFKTEPTPEDLRGQIKIKKAINESAYKIINSVPVTEYPLKDATIDTILELLKAEIKEIFKSGI